MSTITISIAKDFSPYPAGRFREDGKYSGTAFREDHLVPALSCHKQVTVMFDQVEGFGSSFLDEAFGGLIRSENMNKEFLTEHLKLDTNEEDMKIYVRFAHWYINKAAESNLNSS